MIARGAAALALLTLAGCGSAEEPRFRAASVTVAAPEDVAVPWQPPADLPVLIDPSRHVGRLVLEPGDLTTATYETLPTVAVARRGLSERELATLVERVDLVTWPERELVTTRARYLDEAIEPGLYSRVVLEPDRPLEDRWYAIRARFDEADAPDATIAPRDAEYSVSRFRFGAGAVLRRIHAAAREDGGGDVEVVFSERVRVDAEPFAVAVDGEAARCRLVNRDELFGEDGAMRAWLDCPRLAPGASLDLTAANPLYSVVGTEVQDPTGRSLTSLVVSLAEVPPGAPRPAHDRVGLDAPPAPSPTGAPTARTFVPGFGLRDAI